MAEKSYDPRELAMEVLDMVLNGQFAQARSLILRIPEDEDGSEFWDLFGKILVEKEFLERLARSNDKVHDFLLENILPLFDRDRMFDVLAHYLGLLLAQDKFLLFIRARGVAVAKIPTYVSTIVSKAIKSVFGAGNPFLFTLFCNLPEERRKKLWSKILPVVYLEKEGLSNLFAFAISSGWTELEEITEKMSQTDVEFVSGVMTHAVEILGGNSVLVRKFLDLETSRRMKLLQSLIRQTQNLSAEFSGAVLALVAALDQRAIVEEIIAESKEKGKQYARAVARIGSSWLFTDEHTYNSPSTPEFIKLFYATPWDNQVATWFGLMNLAVVGEDEGGIAKLLRRFNPSMRNKKWWQEFITKYSEIFTISSRPWFWMAVSAPLTEHLLAWREFTPQEYAWIVARYIEDHPHNMEKLMSLVEELPAEYLSAICELGNVNPALLPLFDLLTRGSEAGFL